MKGLKVAAIVAVVVIVLVLALVVTGGASYKTISFEEYNNLDSKSVVYIGDEESVVETLKNIELKNGYKAYVLDYSDLSKSEKKKVKAETLEIWKDKKLVAKHALGEFKLAKGDQKLSLKEVKIDDYVKLRNAKGLHFMFIGRETCGYCVKFKEAIKEFYENYKVNIYYIDTDKLDETGFNKLVATDEYLSTEEWGTPTSFIYNNGDLVELINGYVEADGIVAVLDKVEIKVFLMNNKVI